MIVTKKKKKRCKDFDYFVEKNVHIIDQFS